MPRFPWSTGSSPTSRHTWREPSTASPRSTCSHMRTPTAGDTATGAPPMPAWSSSTRCASCMSRSPASQPRPRSSRSFLRACLSRLQFREPNYAGGTQPLKDIMGDKTVRVRADLHHIIKIETAKNGGNVKEVMEIRLRSKLKSVLIVHYLKILYNRN